MVSPLENTKSYFDSLAERWDTIVTPDAILSKLDALLSKLAIAETERILDLGCGTGNLAKALATRLGPKGTIAAVDLSLNMIERARAKINDPRISWLAADGSHVPLPSDSFDRIICFSAWPHFEKPGLVAAEMIRLLKSGGRLHIIHITSKESINNIHRNAGGPIGHHLLPPAVETAATLTGAGFQVEESIDDAERYQVSGRKGFDASR